MYLIYNKSISAHECAFELFVFAGSHFAILCNSFCPVFTIHYVVSFTFFFHLTHTHNLQLDCGFFFIFTQFMVKSMHCKSGDHLSLFLVHLLPVLVNHCRCSIKLHFDFFSFPDSASQQVLVWLCRW